MEGSLLKGFRSLSYKMKQSEFPPGWDVERVDKVLSHYESQSEEEAVAEDESALEKLSQEIDSNPADGRF